MTQHTCGISRIIEPIYEMGSMAPVSSVTTGWMARCSCGWSGWETSEAEMAQDQWRMHRESVLSPEEIEARRVETRKKVDAILEEFII